MPARDYEKFAEEPEVGQEPEERNQGIHQERKRKEQTNETDDRPPTKKRIMKGVAKPKRNTADNKIQQKGKLAKQPTDAPKRVLSEKSGDVFQQYPPRNEIENQMLRAKAQNGDVEALNTGGLKPDSPFTDIFQLSDIHGMIAPDLLHQASKMLFDNLYSWIKNYLVIAHSQSKTSIVNEIDARFSQLPPYPGLKTFANGISRTERWTGNEYKAMAKVLLPTIQDILSDDMVKLVREYLDIIQIGHYISHTDKTVEYLRRSVDEYTKLRSGADGPLVELGLLPVGWFTPKQHSLQHYADWIPHMGPLPFCSTDRSEALHKMHKADYRKSNKNPLSYHRFILMNESRRLAFEWYESTLPAKEVYTGNRVDSRSADDLVIDRVNDEPKHSSPIGQDLVESSAIGIQLGGVRWTGSKKIDFMEEDLKLKDLTNETKKCLRWIRSDGNQTSRRRLEGWQTEEVIQISGHTLAKVQYSAVHDTTQIITEIIRSTESWQFGKNRNRTTPRYDTVLVRWTQEEGANTMSNRRIGRVLLFFSTVCNVTGRKIEMAYVEWLKVVNNTWDKKTEMFKVRRSGEYAVIGIESVERGVHLVPVFKGFATPMAQVGSQPSLEVYQDFWINNWIDGHIYNTIYAQNEKFKD
jgi:hypothetical protein